jgi:hypothetical protein
MLFACCKQGRSISRNAVPDMKYCKTLGCRRMFSIRQVIKDRRG